MPFISSESLSFVFWFSFSSLSMLLNNWFNSSSEIIFFSSSDSSLKSLFLFTNFLSFSIVLSIWERMTSVSFWLFSAVFLFSFKELSIISSLLIDLLIFLFSFKELSIIFSLFFDLLIFLFSFSFLFSLFFAFLFAFLPFGLIASSLSISFFSLGLFKFSLSFVTLFLFGLKIW